jgi:hypothetical protein
MCLQGIRLICPIRVSVQGEGVSGPTMEQAHALRVTLDQIRGKGDHKHDVLGGETHTLSGDGSTQSLKEGGYQLSW